MRTYAWAEQPHQDVGNKVASEEDNRAYPVIEKEQGSAKKQQRDGVRHQMCDVSVYHRTGNDPYEAPCRTGNDAETRKIDVIEELDGEHQPHNEHQAKWNDSTADVRA